MDFSIPKRGKLKMKVSSKETFVAFGCSERILGSYSIFTFIKFRFDKLNIVSRVVSGLSGVFLRVKVIRKRRIELFDYLRFRVY